LAAVGANPGGHGLSLSSPRILFLLTQDLESPSGLGRYWPLARALAGHGYLVRIAALHPNWQGLSDRRYERDGVTVEYVAPMHVRKSGSQKQYYSSLGLLWVALRGTFALCRAVLRGSVDIIYICKPHPMNSLAGLLGRILRKGVLFLDCDDYEAGSNRFGAGWQQATVAFFERRMPRLVRLVTTNTHFMESKLIAWGTPAQHLVYLPNGVDHTRFGKSDPNEAARLRIHLGLEGKRVILYAGSLSLPSHPIDLLLEAFVQVHQSHPETALLVVGGGEDYPNLVEQAQTLGINQVTVFTGRVAPDRVPDYYALAEVSVDPVHDNDAARGRLPLKLFESWACGVPFVTCAVGDRQSLIGQPPAGMLTEKAGDPGSLAQAILQILDSPDLATWLRKRGLERVEEYTWERLATHLQKAYQDLP